MPGTPNPTLSELAEYDSLVNGDMTLTLDELLRRLRQLMPLEIGRRNALRGWSGPDAIPVPVDYQLAPANLSDDFINMILLDVSVKSVLEGIGGLYRNEMALTFYSIDGRIEAQQQVRVAWERAEAIRTCLLPFISGCTNLSNQLCWRSLQPQGLTLLPVDWGKGYSGTAVPYKLVQAPRS